MASVSSKKNSANSINSAKRAVIYARVSTQEQEENGTSLTSQVAACRKYAEANGYTVVETLMESKSGASLNRPMLDEVRQMARDGLIDVVVFYALDRLSRDETDTLILAREWRSHGVEMKCATVPLEDTPSGQFLMTMLAAVGKLERAGIMERFQRGKRQTVLNGRALGGHLNPYGYTYIVGEGRYEVEPYEAEWVKRIFYWYTEKGLSLYAIAKRLHEMGALTKTRRGNWLPCTVRDILLNEAYTGEMWYGKTDSTKGPKRLRPRSEWIGPVAIPALITKETYQAVLRRIEENKQMSKRNTRNPYLLRGMVRCQQCGKAMHSVSRYGSMRYVCGDRHHANTIGRERCLAREVKAPILEEKVWSWVCEKLNSPDLILALISTPDEDGKRQRARDEADLRSLMGVQADLDSQENALIELYTVKAIDLAKFQERKSLIEQRREGVEQAIAEIEERVAQRAEAEANIETVRELCQLVQEGLPMLTATLTFEEKRRILEALRIRGVVNSDGTLSLTGLLSADVLRLTQPDEETEQVDLSLEGRDLQQLSPALLIG